jgi:(p)ppGpp synthase/HD superfamily hydrolase
MKENEKEFLDRAKALATKWHQGQTRKGENVPYIVHPERVVNTLIGLQETRVTATVLAAAWCHDLVEDTQVTEEEIVTETSAAVLQLVYELTNPSKSFVPTEEHYRMPKGSIRRIKKQLDRDHLEKVSWEAKLIKLVDRLDNVTDMKGMDKDFCVLYAQESQQLLDVLRGTHAELETKLESAIRDLRKRHN